METEHIRNETIGAQSSLRFERPAALYQITRSTRQAQDPDGTYTMGYDAAGRITSVQEPFGLSMTFGYDAVGNRTSVKDSTGGVATVTFDARNMQSAEELGGVGVTPIKETRTYTDAGRLDTTTRYKSSFGFWSSVGTTTHAYDAVGRLTGITDKDGMGSALASYAYSYDAADRLTSETINGSQRTYTYDNTNQLTGDAGTNYSYDANGNRTMSGYATGAGNRMSNDGTWTYTYNAEGNVEKKSQGTMYGNWYYEYDHNNQMTGARYSLIDGGTVTQRVTYVYDAFGNRIERDAWDGTTATVERFGMDGWDPAKPTPVGNEQFDAYVDLDGSNALFTRRMYAPGFDEITARESAAGTVGWYLTDHLGSVRGATNGDGTPLTTISYDAWGQVLSNSTPAQSDRYQYTGREWESVMQLWYHRSRIRGAGAWYSEDPLGIDPDNNPHRYIRNKPNLGSDPSGRLFPLLPALIWGIVGGGTGAAGVTVSVEGVVLVGGGILIAGGAVNQKAGGVTGGRVYPGEPNIVYGENGNPTIYNTVVSLLSERSLDSVPQSLPVRIGGGGIGTYISSGLQVQTSAGTYATTTYGPNGGWRPPQTANQTDQQQDCNCNPPPDTSPSSAILGANLAVGPFADVPATTVSNQPQAHHIVAGSAAGAAASRSILSTAPVCIGINDAVNGVWLPQTSGVSVATSTNPLGRVYHNQTFTPLYHAYVFSRLSPVRSSRAGVQGALMVIRQELVSGIVSW